MANPTEVITAFPSSRGLLTGRKGQLYTGPSGAPVVKSLKPTTQVMLGNNQGTPYNSPSLFLFDNATPVAEVITVVFSGIPTAGQKTRVGNVTYTWVASGATGDQINVGASAALSAAALDTKVDADTARTLCTSANSTVTDVLTANTAGIGVDFYTDSTVITATITTANVSDHAYLPYVAANIGTFEPTALTGLELSIPILVGITTINLQIGYTFQTNDTVALGIAGLQAVFNYLLNAGASQIGLTAIHGYIGGLTLAQTFAQVSTALQGMFGSTASVAFKIMSTNALGDTLYFRTGTAGAAGVNWSATSRVRESLPGRMLTTSVGAPADPGWKPVGEFLGFDASAVRNIIKYPVNNSDIESQVAGNSSATAASAIYAQLNLPVQELLSGNPCIQGVGYQVLGLGGSSAAVINAGRGYFFSFDAINSQFDYYWIYCGIAAVQTFKADINAVPATPLAIAPQAYLDRPVDTYAQIHVWNEN